VSGFVAQNVVFVDDKASVTVLTNEDASSAAGALARKIAPLVLDGGAGAASASNPAAEKRALGIFTGLQDGKLDRSQLTTLCSDYFTAEAMSDFAMSLKPLGTPTSFTQTLEVKRGGMTFRVFDVTFPTKKVRVTVYEMPDGKLEQYLVEAVSS
jgi:D-alanyl-D-alanine carboxypeptidase